MAPSHARVAARLHVNALSFTLGEQLPAIENDHAQLKFTMKGSDATPMNSSASISLSSLKEKTLGIRPSDTDF